MRAWTIMLEVATTHRVLMSCTEMHMQTHACAAACALNQMSTTDSGTTRGGTPSGAAAEGSGPQ